VPIISDDPFEQVLADAERKKQIAGSVGGWSANGLPGDQPAASPSPSPAASPSPSPTPGAPSQNSNGILALLRGLLGG